MLLDYLTKIMGDAFEACGIDRSYGRVQMSDQLTVDVQCNGALQAAKRYGKNPTKLASDVVEALLMPSLNAASMLTVGPGDDSMVSGPGFISLKLRPEFLSGFLSKQLEDKKFGFQVPKNETYVVDFCGPNVAKTMHIGHIRSTIIGDSIQRMLHYAGHTVHSDVHLGDWGLPMGMLINEVQIKYPNLVYFKESYNGPFPVESPISFEELCELYPQGSARVKENPDERQKVRLITAKLQEGSHAGYTALWQHFIELSLADIKQKTDALDVHFDHWYGERHTAPLVPNMLQELRNRQLAISDQGAFVINVAREDDKREVPPLILEKTDGGVLYGATDLATIIQRVRDFNPDHIVYVVDQRQNLHFEQVFRAAEKAGYLGKAKCLHVGFGTMNGKDGKPFKTRDGGVLDLGSLLQMVQDKAADRLREIAIDKKLSAEEFSDIAKTIGFAALKFADLSNPPKSDYIFDLDKFVAFEGKTGPYVQYTVVRINSLLQKAAAQNMKPGEIALDESQKEMALLLLEFGDAVTGALGDYAPNVLCDYLFRAAQGVNRYYQAVPVLIEENPAKRGAALALLTLAARILTEGLDLLGIKVPKHM